MRRAMTLIGAVALAAGSLVAVTPGVAFADPSANDWKQLRICESGDNYSINTGNGYYGAYQFDLPTWRSVGGTGRPDQASRAEQDLRALTLYRMRGWAPWICADLVGLTADADAGSGKKPTGAGNATITRPKPDPGRPAFPGTIRPGDQSTALKTFQIRLRNMGYGTFEGTGWYGSKTKAGVVKLQKRAGLSGDGVIGPKTWAAAWNLKYKVASSSNTGVPAFSGTIRPGQEHSKLRLFQIRLRNMGYGTFEGTGWYGSKTKTAVVKLQKKAGLSGNGIIGAKTWAAAWDLDNKIASTPAKKPPVKAPSATPPKKPSQYVPATNASCRVTSRTPLPWGGQTMVFGKTYRDLQCFQRALGSAYGLTGTGYFGPSTRAAVDRLQRKAGLPRTGKVDVATWRAAWTVG